MRRIYGVALEQAVATFRSLAAGDMGVQNAHEEALRGELERRFEQVRERVVLRAEAEAQEMLAEGRASVRRASLVGGATLRSVVGAADAFVEAFADRGESLGEASGYRLAAWLMEDLVKSALLPVADRAEEKWEQALDQARQEGQRARVQVEELQGRVRRYQEKVRQLEAHLATAKTEKEQFVKSQQDWERARERYEAKEATLSASLAEAHRRQASLLGGAQRDKERAMADMESKIREEKDMLAAKLVDAVAAKRLAQQEVASARARVSSAEAETNAAQHEAHAHLETIQQLKSELKSVQHRVNHARRAEESLLGPSGELAGLREQLATLQAAHESTRTTLLSVQLAKDDETRRRVELEKQYVHAQSEWRTVQARVEAESQRAESLTRDLHALRASSHSLPPSPSPSSTATKLGAKSTGPPPPIPSRTPPRGGGPKPPPLPPRGACRPSPGASSREASDPTNPQTRTPTWT